VGELDEAGYFIGDLAAIAAELDVPRAEVERGLALIQTLDPTGVGARSLAECLALQAREADRYDPCMARLIDNLEILAKGDVARLKRLCEVDDEDFADMLAELRGYDPRPGLRFGGGAEAAVVPDVLVTPGRDGGWTVALNEDSLPRLVVNRSYYLELKQGCTDRKSQAWLNEHLGEANWLIRALDQRARTILRVAGEIVKRQAGFFREGVAAMKPLILRDVAEAIEMHESTVSRVTSNKYLACPRGTFEMKYFFSSGVGAGDGEGASSEAVKARIRALIEKEDPSAILSDEALVALLKAEGFDLARRTVAKYREAIGIGSSAERRRARKLTAAL
jgi:RNA polymerase sigma-54 factor